MELDDHKGQQFDSCVGYFVMFWLSANDHGGQRLWILRIILAINEFSINVAI